MHYLLFIGGIRQKSYTSICL